MEEFNRRLSDAMFEVSLSDQGMNPGEQLRRGSLRAFEPPPPLFLPAPQLLEGTVQVKNGSLVYVCDVWLFCDILTC